MRRLLPVALAVSLLAPVVARAQEDCQGCKDHPQIQRFPGFTLSEATENDFNSANFTVADEKEVAKEGHYWNLRYEHKEGAKTPSCLEVLRNYENAFKKGGGRLQWKASDSCTGTLSMPLGQSERWMNLKIWNNGTLIVLEIIEVAPMEQKVEVSASEMLDALNREGFIMLHGILFETGKDAIQPESEPLLAEVVKLLADNPGLALSVEGHTDNVGEAKANQLLSQRRADSVMKYLVGKGVDAKRLSAKGWGDSKPVADNRTDPGRAQNRRVELVKK